MNPLHRQKNYVSPGGSETHTKNKQKSSADASSVSFFPNAINTRISRLTYFSPISALASQHIESDSKDLKSRTLRAIDWFLSQFPTSISRGAIGISSDGPWLFPTEPNRISSTYLHNKTTLYSTDSIIKQLDTSWTLNEMLLPDNWLNLHQIRGYLVSINLIQRQKLNPTTFAIGECIYGALVHLFVTNPSHWAHRDPEGGCSGWDPCPLHFGRGWPRSP